MVIKRNKPLLSNIDEQESLTLARIKNLNPLSRATEYEASRPAANFIDLMNWTVKGFGSWLTDKKNLQKFVHNRIIIDGQFLTFCEEQGITVECLHKDSIVSWRADKDYEKFFAQGVFRIVGKNCEFLHAALFHKGNQNEDEVSFFVVVSESNIENYIKLRNQFDNWIKQRDRGSAFIRVFESDNIPYTKDHSWDDLFLPNPLKKEIKGLVENFLASKEFMLSSKLPWKRGFIMYGEPGNGKTSIIRTIISNYDFKPVTITSDATSEVIKEAFSYAEDQNPSLLYFEDLDALIEKGLDVSTFLNLMDGISARNGMLVVATANNMKNFKSNITNRPSRFDRKFLIPLPNQDMAFTYLKKWFGKSISLAKIKVLAKSSVDNKLSYAYLKDMYISSMFEAIAHNRKLPNEKDIDNALKSLLRDKNVLNSGINTDKYLK